ncbi:hypothetical protein R50072_19410 [Simiduia litorea]
MVTSPTILACAEFDEGATVGSTTTPLLASSLFTWRVVGEINRLFNINVLWERLAHWRYAKDMIWYSYIRHITSRLTCVYTLNCAATVFNWSAKPCNDELN